MIKKLGAVLPLLVAITAWLVGCAVSNTDTEVSVSDKSVAAKPVTKGPVAKPYDVSTLAKPASVLRTPDSHFENLTDFAFKPRYMKLPYQDGAIRMHYLDEGPKDAPVILCLHGQGQWSYAYRHMIPTLVAAGFRVVAPDFIGFGRSDKLPNERDYEFADHVQWLTMFIKEMQFEQEVTAFLFDWGGYFGLRIAAQNPELFDRMVLANTLLPKGKNKGSDFFKKWRQSILARAEFPMGDMVNEGVMTRLAPTVIAAYDAPFPNERYKAGPRRLPSILPVEDSDTAAAANKAAWQQLAAYNKPTMTIFSKMLAQSDDLGPQHLIDHIPGAKGQPHVLISKAGFYIVDDASATLAKWTIDFIRADTP